MRHGVGLSAHWAIAALMAVAVLSLLLPVQASAQELWRGARAGDTPAQIQAKFPKAAKMDYSPKGGSGSKCRWLAGETYIGLNRYGIVDIVNVWYMAMPDSLDDNL